MKGVLSIVVLLLCFSSAWAECVADIDGYSYDLTPLVHATGQQDYVYKTNDAIYFMNVCNNTVGTSNPCGNDAPAYKYDFVNPSDDRDSITTEFFDGDDCWNGNSRVSMVFHCNTTAGAGGPTNVVEIGELCHYVIHWETEYGCSTTMSNKK